MRQKKLVLPGFFILILLLPPFIHSTSNYKYINAPQKDYYFGYISYTEAKHDGNDPVVMREGEEQLEVAVLNFPLVPGDIIRTTESRRCEIQFDTGTIIRLDLNTELKIETILAKSLSSSNEISNLLLNKGEVYVMYKKYNNPEIFQVMTSNSAVRLSHNTVALIGIREDGSTDIKVKYGKANVLYGPNGENLEAKTVKKSMSLTISQDHQALQEEYRQNVDFERWNETMNKDFEELHEGVARIPQPVQRLSKAVFNFAQRHASLYGEWVWDSLYGYVWRPYLNDYYPWGSWQPYFYGQWREIDGQLFWVPEESWGWVPYHLGLWVWNGKLGWLWIPGSAFAPAWVTWDFYFGYYSWRPWTMFDWMYYNGYGYGDLWSYYPGYSQYYYNYYYQLPYENGKKIITSISKDQLKKKVPPPYSMPKEMKGIYKNLVSALDKEDKNVLASLKKIPGHQVIVRKEDLNASRIQEKALNFGQIQIPKQEESFPQKSIKDPYREAVRTFKQNSSGASLGERIAITPFGPKDKGRSLPEKAAKAEAKEKVGDAKGEYISRGLAAAEKRTISQRKESRPSYDPASLNQAISLRFRDWNPDAQVARIAGVSLKYNSRGNEISCPELRISSNTVRGSRNMITMTGFSPSSGGSSYSSYGSGYISRDSSSGSSQRSGGSENRGAGGSGGGSGNSRGTNKEK